MLQPNQIYIRIIGHEGFERDEVASVGLDTTNAEGPEALIWSIYRFDKHGTYFSHPDMAKYQAYNDLDNAYRETIAVMRISSLSGYERGCLKKKEPQDKKRAEKEDRIFWDAFKNWTTK